MAQVFARILTASMPNKIQIVNGMAGRFHIDDVCEALADLTAIGVIGGFDAEDASDNGFGEIIIL